MNENVLLSNDESDSSNLTKATSSHQVESARHLIKLLKRQTISLLYDEQSSAVTFDVKNLVLQKIVFLCEIAMISKRS
jgi:hypothetical protein